MKTQIINYVNILLNSKSTVLLRDLPQTNKYTLMISDWVIEKIERDIESELSTFIDRFSDHVFTFSIDTENTKCLQKWWVWVIPLTYSYIIKQS